ncbi:MAG: hypothetical protein ACK4G1_01025 [Ignavibacteria bacterium]
MTNTTRNALILLVFFVLFVALGGYYVLGYQPRQIKMKQLELESLNNQFLDVSTLTVMYDSLQRESEKVDSILYNMAKAIPFRQSVTDTYNDILNITKSFSRYTRVDIEYDKTETVGAASVDHFNISGQGEFVDVFKLIYELEKSRKLYKISELNLRNATLTTGKGEIKYQVEFDLKLESYFTADTNLALNYDHIKPKEFKFVSDLFYPIIQPDIPPNYDALLEVDGATLLAIIPDAVFIMDKNGNSYTLSEGDPVYLGYLTKINYDLQQCEFLLNRGGIIERVTLKLKAANIKEIKK